MNPQFDKPAMNLPPPVEAGPAFEALAPEPPEAGPARPEAASGDTERKPAAAMPVLMPAGPQTVPQQSNLPANDAANTTAAPTGTPAIADDSDLIEKEWVNKAKEIIEKTREDPHQQSKQITYVKADYMQKRYNKTIKLSE